MVGQLAHGQRQWVELAIVLAQEPELILLDEPAAGMTMTRSTRTAELIREINRPLAHRGRARHALHPHDRQNGDGVQPGPVLMEDTVEAMLRDQRVRDVYLGKQGRRHDARGRSTLHCRLRAHPGPGGVTLFGSSEGEFVGILGHNGMGKTTLLRTADGLPARHRRPRSVSTATTSPGARPPRARGGHRLSCRRGARSSRTLSVRDNLRMGCLRADSGRGRDRDRGGTRGFPAARSACLDRPGGALSGGEQQLLALARCLCGKPRMLLLDEPTEGIQPSIIEEIIETLQASARGAAA